MEPETIRPSVMMIPKREVTPLLLLDDALQRGAPLEVLTKLLDLQDREENKQARKEFNAAFAKAKKNLPVMIKNRTVGFDSKKPGSTRTSYKHADLAEIVGKVAPILAEQELWHRFETENMPNEPITVTCVVGHANGYQIENTLRAGRDESGNKNAIQAVGSTVTYLSRYTLMSILGLAAATDDDGVASEAGGPISFEQLTELQRRIDESGIKKERVCKQFEIEEIADLPANCLVEAFTRIEMFKMEKAKRLAEQVSNEQSSANA